MHNVCACFFFFFNDTATTEIYTLSLHDALPISHRSACPAWQVVGCVCHAARVIDPASGGDAEGKRFMSKFSRFLDRKSTRLNSSHGYISYAVFCLKKKKKQT